MSGRRSEEENMEWLRQIYNRLFKQPTYGKPMRAVVSEVPPDTPWLWLEIFAPQDSASPIIRFLAGVHQWYMDHQGDMNGFYWGYPYAWWKKYWPTVQKPGEPIKPSQAFQAYSRPELENRVVWFGDQYTTTPHYRQFTTAMDVYEFSLSGLRMKVWDNPAIPIEGCAQMWVLCYMTQERPITG